MATRKVTNAILDLAQDMDNRHSVWQAIARECLSYMSEADVADMNRVTEFVEVDGDD